MRLTLCALLLVACDEPGRDAPAGTVPTTVCSAGCDEDIVAEPEYFTLVVTDLGDTVIDAIELVVDESITGTIHGARYQPGDACTSVAPDALATRGTPDGVGLALCGGMLAVTFEQGIYVILPGYRIVVHGSGHYRLGVSGIYGCEPSECGATDLVELTGEATFVVPALD